MDCLEGEVLNVCDEGCKGLGNDERERVGGIEVGEDRDKEECEDCEGRKLGRVGEWWGC